MSDKDKADLADIKRADETVADSDNTARREQREFDHQHRTQRTRLGWLGKIFGEGEEKAGNVAGAIAALTLLVLIFGQFLPVLGFKDDMNEDTTNFLTYVLTLSLGYLFGRGR